MSWSDRCSNCGEHRADCDCGDWNGYKKNRRIKQKISEMYDQEFKKKELNKKNILEFVEYVRTL